MSSTVRKIVAEVRAREAVCFLFHQTMSTQLTCSRPLCRLALVTRHMVGSDVVITVVITVIITVVVDYLIQGIDTY